MHTRPMTLNDIAYIADLEVAHTPSPWSPDMFQEEMILKSYCRILEDASGTCMGYIVARLQFDEWHLLTLGIAPAFRRQNGAKHLLGGLIQYASMDGSRAIILEVRVSNEPAKKLYQDMGFKFLYTRKAYYRFKSGTEDAIVLDYRFNKGSIYSSI